MIIRSKKQIYHAAIIKEKSVNYHLILDKTKMNSEECLKLLKYLQPERILIDETTIDFYNVNQRKELKLLCNKPQKQKI